MEHVTNYFAVFSKRVVKCFDSTNIILSLNGNKIQDTRYKKLYFTSVTYNK